jgi:surface antigen
MASFVWQGQGRCRRGVFAGSTFVFALLTSVLMAVLVPTAASAGVDDYPSRWRNAPMRSAVDTWNEYNRHCTSFVAWRLHSRNGFEMPFSANAAEWGTRAGRLGFPVDGTPAVGAVAWDPAGHVAWVESVSDGKVVVEEYNYGYTGAYHERTVSTGAFRYIHFKDIVANP